MAVPSPRKKLRRGKQRFWELSGEFAGFNERFIVLLRHLGEIGTGGWQ